MIYTAYNGPVHTQAVETPGQSTGTAIRTMMQIATPSTFPIFVLAWGISFEGSAAATPVTCELLYHVGATAASGLTAYSSTTVRPYDAEAQAASSGVQMGTALSGYGTTAAAPTEGTFSAATFGDLQYVAPSSGYMYEWSLGREFFVPLSSFLRVRVKAAAAVDCITWVRWRE